MKLTVFNGSPRGTRSNTKILLNNFLEGFSESQDNEFDIHYLNRVDDQDKFKQAFSEASHVLLAFPLYTDAMPGIVKCFIESLSAFRGNASNPSLGFIVQSGFPEAAHSRRIEKYNCKLAQRLGCVYLGTVIKGGAEGIQVQPPKWTAKLFANFKALGQIFGQTGKLDGHLMAQLATPEHFRLTTRMLYRVLKLVGLTDFYWNSQLKKNDVFEQRFAMPYS